MMRWLAAILISTFVLLNPIRAQEKQATPTTETQEQQTARFKRTADELLALGFTKSRKKANKSATETYELDAYTGRLKLKDWRIPQ